MTNDFYTADKAHLLKAKKMALFGNGDAKLEAADVQKMDEYIAGRLFRPSGLVAPLATGASYLPKFKTNSWLPGKWEELLFFQTGMNLYPALGGCVTADDTPSAGLYTKTFSIRTSQTPTNQGRHWERENDTPAESERIDIFRMMLNHLHIECSQAVPVALQRNKWGCAYTKSSGTDEITPSQCTDRPYRWSDLTFPTFTYNSETIEATIIGWAFDVVNTLHYTGLTSNRFSIGRYIPLTYVVTTLEINPYGHNIFELIDTELESYLTDVDLTVKCARSATDYTQWVHDKVYCQPFVIAAEKAPGSIERYVIVLSQLSTGSITPTEVNAYDDDYYET